MGLFDADFEAADALFAEGFGTTVSISRGNGKETSNVPAEVISLNADLEDNDSTPAENLENRTYLIAVADYQIRGEVVKPKVGDFITEAINGTNVQYTVAPTNQPSFEPLNPNRTRWVIRTKRL